MQGLIFDVAPIAQRLGLRVFIVGGVVRDLIEGKPVAGEWDLVVMGGMGTGARRLAERLSAAWKWKSPVSFPRFGTYLVSGPHGVVELAQSELRIGSAIRSSDPIIQDAHSRDFTLNALYVELDVEGAGAADGFKVIDPTGLGIDDLNSGILRTPVPPRATLGDDPVRILRAARLCATHGYRTARPITRAARGAAHLLRDVSVERVLAEMNKLLLGSRPSNGLVRLEKWGVFRVLMPEVQAMVGFMQRTPHHFPDLWRHTLRVVDRTSPDLALRWAALLHDCGKPAVRTTDGSVDRYLGHERAGSELAVQLVERLRMGKNLTREVAGLVGLHMVHYTDRWTDRAVRKFIVRSGGLLPKLLDLLEADSRSLRLRADKLHAVGKLRDRVRNMKAAMPSPESPLSGLQIMDILNIGPGPEVGMAKTALVNAVLNGDIPLEAGGAGKFLVSWWKGGGGKLS